MQRGNVFMKQGHLKEAENDYRKAVFVFVLLKIEFSKNHFRILYDKYPEVCMVDIRL